MNKRSRFVATLIATLVGYPTLLPADEPQAKQEVKVTTVVVDDGEKKSEKSNKQKVKVVVVDGQEGNDQKVFSIGGSDGQGKAAFVVRQDGKAFRVRDDRSKLWLGIGLKSIEGDLADFLGTAKGVLIESVDEKGPAAKVGMQRGDILLAVDNSELEGPTALIDVMKSAKPEQVIVLKIRRKDEIKELKVTPEPRPQEAEMNVELDLSEEPTDSSGGKFRFHFDPVKMQGFRLGSPAWITRGDGSTFKGNAVMSVVNNGKTTEVKIERNGDEQAKITVTEDGETKVYSESQIDEIPEGVRDTVKSMILGRPAIGFSSSAFQDGAMSEAQKAMEQAAHGLESSKALAEAFNSPEFRKHLDEIRSQASAEVGAATKKAAEEARRAMEDAKQHAKKALDRSKSERTSEVDELRKMVAEMKKEIAELKAKAKQE